MTYEPMESSGLSLVLTTFSLFSSAEIKHILTLRPKVQFGLQRMTTADFPEISLLISHLEICYELSADITVQYYSQPRSR